MDGKVDQDVREAAIAWLRSTPHGSRHAEADMIERGEYDDHSIVQAFARMKEAGRQAGLREAAEVVESLPWDESRVGNANFDDTKEYAVKAITALIEGEGK